MNKVFRLILGLSISTIVLCSQSFGQGITVTSSNSPDYHFKINGNDFFPIGWYNCVEKNDLINMKSKGVNVVINYWNSVWNKYKQPNQTDYSVAEYKMAIGEYLKIVDSLGIKVIIDVAASHIHSESSSGWTKNAILDIVNTYKNDPGVFGWYVADEPEGTFNDLAKQYPTPSELLDISNSIRTNDNGKHPVFIVIATSEFYEFPGHQVFSPNTYDILGWDSYVFTPTHDQNKYPWTDFNNLSRIATARGMSQIKSNNKWGHIFVGMAHDNYQDTANFKSRQMSNDDILYESISPIISGSRGLLYWWYNPIDAAPNTLNNINTFIKFFKDNNFQNILLQGLNKDNSIQLSNFKLNNISEDRNNYIWGNYHNNYNNGSTFYPEPTDFYFKEFNYIVRKYNGTYYIFAVNDFKPTVNVTFVLDNMLSINETVTQITELNAFGSTISKSYTIGNNTHNCSFSDVLNSYKTKIYKINYNTNLINGPAIIAHPSAKTYTNSYTWNVNVSGGTAPFSYSWKKDGSSIGGNTSSYSVTLGYAGNGSGSISYLLSVTVTDALGKITTYAKNVEEFYSDNYGGAKISGGTQLSNIENIPQGYELSSNYPNPFNPETQFRIGIPEDSNVKVSIIDLLGHEITSLIDGNLSSGYHNIIWNGTTSLGQRVTSGIYFYRMTAISKTGKVFMETKKATLLK